MDKALEKKIERQMAEWLAQGKDLSEIQTLVNQEFQQKFTYMDIRIMASALSVDWKALDPNQKPEPKKEEPVADVSENAAEPETAAPAFPEEPEAPAGAAPLAPTVVELSKLARPGMMFSGTVRFANGSTAEWYVDTTGRLGLENLQGTQPGAPEIEAFQVELDKVLRKAMGR